ncbi:MAG: complex I NDUFA9 subunit family protein [Gemmatimonadota bacterium]
MEAERRLSVFLTGGTGFVGGYVARRLVERGHQVRALVREPATAGRLRGLRGLRDLGIDLVRGDVTQEKALGDAVAGCETAIHLVGIIREKPPSVTFEKVHTLGTMRVVEAARQAQVRKFVHMSALGARPEGTAYQRTKFEAEEVVRRSDITHVIFRPSIIVGPNGEFVDLLLRVLRMSPVTPVIGDGRYRLQPVDVEDVAAAFVQAAERDDVEDECFEIGGPHKLTYNRMLEIVCEEFGLRRLRFHVPVSLVKPLVNLASNWRLPTPVTSDELAMLFEESIVPGDKNVLREVFGLEPNSLRSVLQRFPRARRRRRHAGA